MPHACILGSPAEIRITSAPATSSSLSQAFISVSSPRLAVTCRSSSAKAAASPSFVSHTVMVSASSAHIIV